MPACDEQLSWLKPTNQYLESVGIAGVKIQGYRHAVTELSDGRVLLKPLALGKEVVICR